MCSGRAIAPLTAFCRATHVPVGDDQLQHLELAKEVARLFHNRYQSELFPVPEPLLSAVVMDKDL